ncbi:NADH-quinone oxidoreductase subunit NuoI [Thermococcus nautili]|uniref:Formate hydrogenlyase subunit 6/NADH:ubiquinone oxidoreductase 23 kD subunit (Chain I) n=1 Tax=Thermococcus nautili TaxID=195522 RepID=W8PIS0_9EURY|nr:NADH-quinone oxidoreductase subunit NuoI [Thermococcus nautili]AHL22014.1 Formate hydrogenlyase subunit 6/NADH:ubiquinone oxidoreductase 23 kD subunit (chain I) [Thermococcus nautili]
MPARVVGEEKVKLKKSFVKPWMGIKYLFKKPVTIKIPFEKIEPAPKYRGFHTLDWKKCVGCNFCGQICPARAIEMTWLEVDGKMEKRPHPKVDYGRCTFCQFCVDVCPTGALGFSEAYILTTDGTEDALELFNWVPIHPDKVRELNEKYGDYRFPVVKIEKLGDGTYRYHLRDGEVFEFKILGYGIRPPKKPTPAKPATKSTAKKETSKPAEKTESKPAEKKEGA